MTDRCLAPKCGRRLKTDESKNRGYGPVCWRRINPAAPVIPAPAHAADPNQIPLPLEATVPNEPQTFRKKPVEIQAIRWDGTNFVDMLRFIEGDLAKQNSDLYIPTLEGEMVARPGDWIIRGVADEFYPCKPDIFEATYEPVTRGEAAMRDREA